MSTVLKRDKVSGPLGTFDVSTIRTMAGGAPASRGFGPFSDEAFLEETPWPFETMVFNPGSSVGLYHAAYETEPEAMRGHSLMILTIEQGLEFGGGVEGEFGTPSLKPEEWRARVAHND